MDPAARSIQSRIIRSSRASAGSFWPIPGTPIRSAFRTTSHTGGYQSLLRAVTEMTPEEIIAEVRRSGLRGRGGAGYPAGLKWELVARQPSPVKYVVCNADEGDPGAFMNRSVLEGDPHRVLEGMAIAGRAVGAQQGYIYVRGESPLAIARLQHRARTGAARRTARRPHFRKQFQFPHRSAHRRWRLRLRRRDRAAGLHRRQTRAARSAAALSAGARAVGTSRR